MRLFPLIVLAAAAAAALGSVGCRFVSYPTEHGRAWAGSVLTDPRGSYRSRTSPTTQSTDLDYESKSNFEAAAKLLDAAR